MSASILVDTSFLVSYLDERDVHHQIAKALHELFLSRDVVYIYLDCVVNEAATVLARRALERKVEPGPFIQRLRREITPDMLDWTGPELPRLWEHTLDLMEQHKGVLSFHDCLIVLAAQEGGIQWIASFDQRFDQVSGLKRIETIADFTSV